MMRSEWAETGLVHNHGIDPSCRETMVDGKLKGECMMMVEPSTDTPELLKVFVDDPFEQALDGILSELRETMLRKHRDYGPKNISNAPGGAINGLRVRMHDKLARINNLYEAGADPENESVQDSYLDISNYGIIGLMVLRGAWPGCEK